MDTTNLTAEEPLKEEEYAVLRILDQLAGSGDTLADIDQDDPDLVAVIADYEPNPDSDVYALLDLVVLEVVVTRRGDLSTVGDIADIELVVTTGGPDDRYRIRDDGTTHHDHTEWFAGPGTFDRYIGEYPQLAEWLYGLADNFAPFAPNPGFRR